MASAAADRGKRAELPAHWERLERAAEEAAMSVSFWKRRAVEAEEELTRLRQSLERVASVADDPADLREEAKRLRAENAALHSRMQQARKRVQALLKRVMTLESET